MESRRNSCKGDYWVGRGAGGWLSFEIFTVGIKAKHTERRPLPSLQEKKYSQNLPRMLSSAVTTMPVQVAPCLLPAYSPVVQLKSLLIVCLHLFALCGDNEWGILSHSTLLCCSIDWNVLVDCFLVGQSEYNCASSLPTMPLRDLVSGLHRLWQDTQKLTLCEVLLEP